MKTAIIILGHGSRGNGIDAAIKSVADTMKVTRSHNIVEYAFLQYAQPTTDAALDSCIKQGATEIVIVPFFMQAGSHVTKDIPDFIDRARALHPECRFRVTDYVGAHPLMTQIVMDLVGRAK
jgi:sirohydrochlorin ferrochelatase